MKKKYQIILEGCDASTEFIMELDENEIKIVKEISRLSIETSTYGCMPTLNIFEVKE